MNSLLVEHAAHKILNNALFPCRCGHHLAINGFPDSLQLICDKCGHKENFGLCHLTLFSASLLNHAMGSHNDIELMPTDININELKDTIAGLVEHRQWVKDETVNRTRKKYRVVKGGLEEA